MHTNKESSTAKHSPENELEASAPAAPFADHRPVAQQQRAVQQMANESPQVTEGMALQMKINNSSHVKQLQGTVPARPQTVNSGGFIGSDGQIVQLELVEERIVIRGNNASADLQELITATNNAGSTTGIAEIMEIAQSPTRVHVRVVDQFVDNDLYGLHQAHDADGNALEWNPVTNDFNGVPAYAGPGVYAEATITIYKGNIIRNVGNSSGGDALNSEQMMASTFQHEAHHDTDREFIQDLRNRRNGEENEGIDPHQNIHPQDTIVEREMREAARSNTESEAPNTEGEPQRKPGIFRRAINAIKRLFGG